MLPWCCPAAGIRLIAGHAKYSPAEIASMFSCARNRSRVHDIEKLQGVPAGEGQHRLRPGRPRFRYDIAGRVVTLVACNLRREDTCA